MEVIHIVLGKANPDRLNGINKVVHSLASQQYLNGANVHVWGITPTPYEQTITRNYKIRFFNSKFFKMRVDPDFIEAVKKTSKDTIFHMHGGFIVEFYLIARLLKRENKNYVITPHGNYMGGAMKKNSIFERIYFFLFERKILKEALFIHCIGAGEIIDLKKIYSLFNYRLIPNGQDFDSFNFLFNKINRIQSPVFGFCGRLSMYQKGLDLLLDGFKIYKKNMNGGGLLWFVGDGDYKNQIINFAKKHNLDDYIIVFGSKFGAEKLNIMANMDAFYHTSRSEGLPMAVLEAAVLGKALVISEYTNMTEYVSKYNAGICLKQNSPSEIADSMNEISQLLSSNNLRIMGSNARIMAEENFDWKIIANKLLSNYASTTFTEIA